MGFAGQLVWLLQAAQVLLATFRLAWHLLCRISRAQGHCHVCMALTGVKSLHRDVDLPIKNSVDPAHRKEKVTSC